MSITTVYQPGGTSQPGHSRARAAEQRSATRYVSLIRAAKLVTPEGEFACVVRDVSQTGTRIKLFHALPPGRAWMALELQNGERFELRLVRTGEGEASFAFAQPVAVERLVREHWSLPKRQFRLRLCAPVRLSAGDGRWTAEIGNLSQQGAHLTTDARFATNQMLRIEAAVLPTVHAKVRWQRGRSCGVVFEDTFSLPEFAGLAARMQCPILFQGTS